MLGRKLHSGTFKTKKSRAGLVRVPLFLQSHSVPCIPAEFIPFHVTRSCKGSIVYILTITGLYITGAAFVPFLGHLRSWIYDSVTW